MGKIWELSTGYPQVIHRLSTGYPQVIHRLSTGKKLLTTYPQGKFRHLGDTLSIHKKSVAKICDSCLLVHIYTVRQGYKL